ncbi:MAG: 50S ribosomal protein L13 [Acidobacteria bacterium]|nr:MAG: 50S ribosomal protein L13 [Acidobacteriota bacterium]
MSTYFPSSKTVEPHWYVVDAEGEVLGRFASRVAQLLRGKNAPHYTPFMDTGEHVVIINAAKIRVTGNKVEDKEYHHFTGTAGGLKTATLRVRMAKHPEEVVRDAVEGMLPKTKFGKHLCSKLKVYRGAEHPHTAQQPEAVKLTKQRAAGA